MRRMETKLKEKTQRVIGLEKEVEQLLASRGNDNKDKEMLRMKKQLTLL